MMSSGCVCLANIDRVDNRGSQCRSASAAEAGVTSCSFPHHSSSAPPRTPWLASLEFLSCADLSSLACSGPHSVRGAAAVYPKTGGIPRVLRTRTRLPLPLSNQPCDANAVRTLADDVSGQGAGDVIHRHGWTREARRPAGGGPWLPFLSSTPRLADPRGGPPAGATPSRLPEQGGASVSSSTFSLHRKITVSHPISLVKSLREP